MGGSGEGQVVVGGKGRGCNGMLFVFCVVIKSKMGLYVSVYVSFNCKLPFVNLCIWN
jgi:hypothetical protein